VIRAVRATAAATRRTTNADPPFSDQHPAGTAPAVAGGPHRRKPVRRRAAHVQFRGGRVLRIRHGGPHPGRSVSQARRACGEPVEISKAEVANGNGRKSIQWQVARVGFAPGEQPDGTFAVAKPEPPSELEQKLAASIAMVESRKAAAQAQASGP